MKMFGLALFDDTTLFPSSRSNGDMKSPPKMDNSVSIGTVVYVSKF